MSSTKKISGDEFLRIANLAKIPITSEDDYIAGQLSEAADYVKILNQLPTESLPPTAQVNHLKDVFRQDEVTPSLSQSDALSQAPKTHNGYIVTKATIKK